MKRICLYIFVFCVISHVEAIWDTLHAHSKEVTSPPIWRRRSSTDTNGEVIFDNEINWDQTPQTVNSVTPKSFSEIFTGRNDELHPNLVLVKKNNEHFVPLKSTEENVFISSTTTTPRPPTTTSISSSLPGQEYIFVTPSSTMTKRYDVVPTITSTTRRPLVTSTTTTPNHVYSSTKHPGIVVLSRDRYIHHRPDSQNLVFVTPKSNEVKSTTTAKPVVVSSTTTTDGGGVPASGHIPKGWSIFNYDPRRNPSSSLQNRFSMMETNDRHSITTSKPNAAPNFVTPLSTLYKQEMKPQSTSEAEFKKETSQPQSTSEAAIERLRQDYKKRRDFIERIQNKRRTDTTTENRRISIEVKTTPSTTTTTASPSTTASYALPHLLSEPYTKGPSIRFVEEDPAQDRSFFVTPKTTTRQYQVVHSPGGVSTVYEELTTPYTTTASSYGPPPPALETHDYNEVHYVETTPPPPPLTSTYLPPTKSTPKPTFSTILPISTTTTTYPPITTRLKSTYDPTLPPTSLTPPLLSAASNNVYTVRPSLATTQASVITTTGAIITPKNGLTSYNGLIPPHQGVTTTPAIIILQAQPDNAMAKPIDAPPKTKVEDTAVVFPDDDVLTTEKNANYKTPVEPKKRVIDNEITEKIQGSGEVSVALNDTVQMAGDVQQSINLKINVYVENDGDNGTSKEEVIPEEKDSTTSPSLPYREWKEPEVKPKEMEATMVAEIMQALTLLDDKQEDEDFYEVDTQALPLTYTSSSSFRQNQPVPSPATAEDYLYDSELSHEDYYYDDSFPEVETSALQMREKEKEITEIDLTDMELFELYDDLSEIIDDVEVALQKQIPTTTSAPPLLDRPRFEPQNIYDYIASKPLKSPKQKWPRKKKRRRRPTKSSKQKTKKTRLEPFSREELLRPVEPEIPVRPVAGIRVTTPFPKVTSKRSQKYYYGEGRPRTPSPPVYEISTRAEDFYNLTKDLIPDLQVVSKPYNWNVRDFSSWEKMFAPRYGQAEIAYYEEEDGDDEVKKRRRKKKRPEKIKNDDVGFDQILKRNPRRQMKFSRLIKHDIDRKDNYDHEDDVYHLYEALAKRRGVGYYERMPRDSFSGEASYYRPPEAPLPTFDMSFEDWLHDSGVSPSRHSFHHQHGLYSGRRNEGYFHRKK